MRRPCPDCGGTGWRRPGDYEITWKKCPGCDSSFPWPYGIGYSEERPCEVCGAYVTYTDDGPPACGEPCAKEAA